jgi:hypothetical protein
MDGQNSLLKFIILDDDPRGPKQSGDARGISSISHQQRRDVERGREAARHVDNPQ